MYSGAGSLQEDEDVALLNAWEHIVRAGIGVCFFGRFVRLVFCLGFGLVGEGLCVGFGGFIVLGLVVFLLVWFFVLVWFVYKGEDC